MAMEVGKNGKYMNEALKKICQLTKIFLKPPKLLILDEDALSIPEFNSNFFVEQLFREMNDCGIISICKNYRNLHLYTRVYIMKNGAIAEQGCPLELIGKKTSILYSILALDDIRTIRQLENKIEKNRNRFLRFLDRNLFSLGQKKAHIGINIGSITQTNVNVTAVEELQSSDSLECNKSVSFYEAKPFKTPQPQLQKNKHLKILDPLSEESIPESNEDNSANDCIEYLQGGNQIERLDPRTDNGKDSRQHLSNIYIPIQFFTNNTDQIMEGTLKKKITEIEDQKLEDVESNERTKSNLIGSN